MRNLQVFMVISGSLGFYGGKGENPEANLQLAW